MGTAFYAHRADRGIFVTTSTFTEPARRLAAKVESKRIVLIDGEELVAWAQANPALGENPDASGAPSDGTLVGYASMQRLTTLGSLVAAGILVFAAISALRGSPQAQPATVSARPFSAPSTGAKQIAAPASLAPTVEPTSAAVPVTTPAPEDPVTVVEQYYALLNERRFAEMFDRLTEPAREYNGPLERWERALSPTQSARISDLVVANSSATEATVVGLVEVTRDFGSRRERARYEATVELWLEDGVWHIHQTLRRGEETERLPLSD